MRKTLATALLTTAMVGAMGAPATAGSSSAQPYRDSGCHVDSQGLTHCYEVHGITKVTETPSGNYRAFSHGVGTVTLTTAEGVEVLRTTSKARTSTSVKRGRTHLTSILVRNVYAFETYDCLYTMNVRVVRDRVVHDQSSYTCS